MSNRKVEIHKEIVMGLNDLYAAKNSDYGDSFTNTRNKFDNAILIRLNDKLARLETLIMKGNARVPNEGIDDTLRDLANYAIMELVERQFDIEEGKFYITISAEENE
jgi:hypothetical protein